MDDLSNPSTLIDPDIVFNQDEFISILKKILEGKTQLQLSKETGLNHATISRMLNGTRSGRPYKSTVDKIAKAINDPKLIADLYDATGYSEAKIKRRSEIISGNRISPDHSNLVIHENFFSSLMRGLSLMNDLHHIPWTLKKGTSHSDSYLIEFSSGNLDYWYIRYVDRILHEEKREDIITKIYGDFAKFNFNGAVKFSCVTPSYEDFDYFVTVAPYQLYGIVSTIYYNEKIKSFEQETLLDSALPVKQNYPIENFCELTSPDLI